MPSAHRIKTSSDATLFAETFGNSQKPPLLLIMGASGPGMRWEDGFCQKLAEQFFVIRYDHRDTGQSTTYPPGKPQYTMDTLVDDAFAVLDGLGVASAHVAGISLGGMIAQLMAIAHPQRLRSLILIATTPSAPGTDDPDLPVMSKAFLDHVRKVAPPDWSDKAATIRFIVERERICAGNSLYFDQGHLEALWSRIYDHTNNFASAMQNHFLATGHASWRAQLSAIQLPCLVIHGEEDPVMPLGHGEALAEEIPHASLLRIPRMGHEVLPSGTWPIVLPAITALLHTAHV